MKVFQYVPTATYSFGFALVAAETKEAADEIVTKEFRTCLKMEFDGVIDALAHEGKPDIIVDTCGEE